MTPHIVGSEVVLGFSGEPFSSVFHYCYEFGGTISPRNFFIEKKRPFTATAGDQLWVPPSCLLVQPQILRA